MLTAVMLFSVENPIVALDIFNSSASVTDDRSSSENALSEQKFVLTPEDGVTVTLEGLMPTGGHAEGKPADVKEKDVLHAYDITIFWPDGREFEPEENSPISLSSQGEAISVALADDKTTLEAEHIADNGKKESVELVSAEDDKAVLEAESFSIYLIKEHSNDTTNLNPRRIYHFIDPNYTYHSGEGGDVYYTAAAYKFPNKHNDLVSAQIIRSGESLQEIVLPANTEVGLFYGWYVVEIDENESTEENFTYRWGSAIQRVEFNTKINYQATDDQHIYLAPLFGHYRFLTFHQDVVGGENANMIIARKLVVLNEETRKAEIKVSDVRAPSTNPNRIVFWGWKYTHNGLGDPYDDGPVGDEKTEEINTVNSDDTEKNAWVTIHDEYRITGVQPSIADLQKMIFDIYPVFKEARWFYFDTGGNGADYIPARFVMVDDPIEELSKTIPYRDGYGFDGWFCSVDRGNGTTEEVRVTTRFNQFLGEADLNTGVSISRIDNQYRLTIDSTASEQYFYAKWRAAELADYQVIIWKQKITDQQQ